MSRFRSLGFSGALVAAALVGGTIVSAVTAAPQQATAPDSVPAVVADEAALASGVYCQTFRRAFAANLGVEESALAPAAMKAAIVTIDAALAAGDIGREVADRLRAKVEAADGEGCRWFAGVLKRAAGAIGVIRDGLAAAAAALDMTPRDLRAEIRSGKALKEIAAAHGVDYDIVTSAVVVAVKADLDAAVKAGSIAQARADRILERIERNLAEGRLRTPKTTPPPAAGG
jgi:hypothetical protein